MRVHFGVIMRYIFIFTSIVLLSLNACSLQTQTEVEEDNIQQIATDSTVVTGQVEAVQTPTLSRFVSRVSTTTPKPSLYPSPELYASDGSSIPLCDNDDMSLWIGTNGAMGEILIYVGVENISPAPCIVQGPVYLTIRDRQNNIAPVQGNGNGAMLEELLPSHGKTAIIFSWGGCPDAPNAQWLFIGAAYNQEIEMVENGSPRCFEASEQNNSVVYPARLTDEGVWLSVIEVTPTP
jgi:hypothetical protein